jgi:ElaB/YqjD/DUF883 family membrane-anchored ribosome-binding protein
MAERVHRSADVPNFDTYPASPPVSDGSHLLEQRKSSLEQRAAELGAAAGKVVCMVRQARATAENLSSLPGFERINSLAENARVRVEYLRLVAAERAQEWTNAARNKTLELGRQARERTAELGRQAKDGYSRAQVRAKYTMREYPVHVALAVGAVGFLAGVALRIRRANRAY